MSPLLERMSVSWDRRTALMLLTILSELLAHRARERSVGRRLRMAWHEGVGVALSLVAPWERQLRSGRGSLTCLVVWLWI